MTNKTFSVMNKNSKSNNSGGSSSSGPRDTQCFPDLPLSAEKELLRASEELQTVFDVFRFAVTRFTQAELVYGHSTTTPCEDAALLLLHELALPISDSVQQWGSARLTASEREHLLALVFRRIHTRKPLPYLLHGVYQQGEYFYVDERVLIPRSFIGEILKNRDLVRGSSSAAAPLTTTSSSSQAKDASELDYSDYFGEITDIARFAQDTSAASLSSVCTHAVPAAAPVALFDHDKVESVLDLCTGSGCLGILAAKFLPSVRRVDAVDISDDALDVARENVAMHGLEDVVSLYEGDLFKALPTFYQGDLSLDDDGALPAQRDEKDKAKGKSKDKAQTFHGYHQKYDLIISNPPYVTTEDMRHLPREYAHEPALALEAGKDGLAIVTRILRHAQEYLHDGGGLLCEVGQCKPALEKRFKRVFGPQSKTVHWIKTENSVDEVFFIKKEHLKPEYFV